MEFKLDKEELKVLDKILTYDIVDRAKLKCMIDFMIKHIDVKVKVCSGCPTQIRFAHKQIVNWANKNQDKINEIRYDTEE